MNSRWIPRAIVALLGVASLAATVLLTMMVIQRHTASQPGAVYPISNSDPLEPMFEVPAFALTNQDNQKFSNADLEGQLWVANFFFTQCRNICPSVSGEMARLQMYLKNKDMQNVHLVSFSIDAGHDTPEELAAYAKQFDIDSSRWTLLTGPREDVWSLIDDGFKLSVEAMDDPDQPFSHSSSFVLVDGQGRVRRYYHNMHESAQAKRNLIQLMTDLNTLRPAHGGSP